jgi:hypothetical protein
MSQKTLHFEVEDAASIKKQPPLAMYGGAWFLDHQPAEIRWLIPGLLPVGVPVVMASKGGLGKSWLALQMCVAVATGRPFLDYPPCSPRAAAFFGLEDSKEVFHRRFLAVVNLYRQLPDWSDEDENLLRRNFVAPYVNWASDAATTSLADLMPSIRAFMDACGERGLLPGVFVGDTLARISDGDENSVAAMRPTLNACQEIADRGWTPLILHHVAKGQDGARTKEKPTILERMSPEWIRGTGSIVANFRHAIQLAQVMDHEAQPAGLDPERCREGQFLIFGVTKSNGPQKGGLRFCEQDDAGRWFIPQDGPETMAKLMGQKAAQAHSSQMALLVAIYEAFREGREPNRADLAGRFCATAKDPQAALRTALRKLRTANFIHRETLALTPEGVQRSVSYLRQGGHAGGENAI